MAVRRFPGSPHARTLYRWFDVQHLQIARPPEWLYCAACGWWRFDDCRPDHVPHAGRVEFRCPINHRQNNDRGGVLWVRDTLY